MEVLYRGMDLQSKFPVNDSSHSLKVGDTIQIVVKEKTSSNEANVVIKGQEVSVKFEGTAPSQGRMMVEVTNLDSNGKMIVKPIVGNSTPSSSITADQLLEKAGFDPATHTDLKEAVKQILSGGGSISRDTLTNLQNFLQNDNGSLEEKLNTIKIMQQKNIEFTEVQLHVVNTALNGNLTNPLSDLMNSSIGLFGSGKNNSALNDVITKLFTIIEPLHDKEGIKDFNEVSQSQQADKGQTSLENVHELAQIDRTVQQELDNTTLLPLNQTLSGNQENLQTIMDSKKFNQKETINPIQTQNKDKSQATPPNERDNKMNVKMALSNPEQYLLNEVIQAVPLDSKNLVVTKVTTALKQMSADFNQMRQEMSQNLETAVKVADTKNVTPVKQILELTINKLDNAILKGDYMLHADMSTEKDLLASSSKLAEAKNLLMNGKLEEAIQIVKEVKGSLDQLTFQPSKQTINRFVTDNDLSSSNQMVDTILQTKTDQGARRIFEIVKGLGLTHEVDSAQSLESKNEMPNNLKSVLLQLAENDPSQTKLMHPLEQALANITGQQLLSKQDSSGVQNMLLQLPIIFNKQVENVKVYVNSHKKTEKVDWENCSLYFVLETKKLGDLGISISAVNRNLSITFKSDNDSLKQTLEPLTVSAKEHLQELGYQIGTIQYKPFSAQAVVKKEPVNKQIKVEEKGFNFTV